MFSLIANRCHYNGRRVNQRDVQYGTSKFNQIQNPSVMYLKSINSNSIQINVLVIQHKILEFIDIVIICICMQLQILHHRLFVYLYNL